MKHTSANDADLNVVADLTRWFRQRLARAEVQFGDEPLSYDGNTRYDFQFYRFQQEAAEHWQRHHGFVPTPGQLMQAFFRAEYDRFEQANVRRLPWAGRLRYWFAESRQRRKR